MHGEEGIKVFLKNPYDFRLGGNFDLLANRNFKDQNEKFLICDYVNITYRSFVRIWDSLHSSMIKIKLTKSFKLLCKDLT